MDIEIATGTADGEDIGRFGMDEAEFIYACDQARKKSERSYQSAVALGKAIERGLVSVCIGLVCGLLNLAPTVLALGLLSPSGHLLETTFTKLSIMSMMPAFDVFVPRSAEELSLKAAAAQKNCAAEGRSRDCLESLVSVQPSQLASRSAGPLYYLSPHTYLSVVFIVLVAICTIGAFTRQRPGL